MSQIGSSSGVRVAAQPLSNVYTVLLLVGGVALITALVFLCLELDKNYGTILGITEKGEANKTLHEKVETQQEERRQELEEVDKALKRFPEGVTASPDAGAGPAGAGSGTSAPETPPAGTSTEPPVGDTTEPAGDAAGT